MLTEVNSNATFVVGMTWRVVDNVENSTIDGLNFINMRKKYAF